MQPSVRYALAVLVGAVAGSLASLGARSVVDSSHLTLVVGLNVLVWTVATALYLTVYERIQGVPAAADESGTVAAAKWGGVAGGMASVGISGAALLLAELVPFRYVAVVGLFVFGVFLAGMAVGTGALASRFDAPGRDAAAGHDPGADTGPDADGRDGAPTGVDD